MANGISKSIIKTITTLGAIDTAFDKLVGELEQASEIIKKQAEQISQKDDMIKALEKSLNEVIKPKPKRPRK